MAKKPSNTPKAAATPAPLATSAKLATPVPATPQAVATGTAGKSATTTGRYETPCEQTACTQTAPLAVQLYRQTPDPSHDPYTAYYLMVRSANEFLSYNNFETFLTGVLGTQSNYPGLAQLPPFEKLASIASFFVACHGEWVKTCFQHGVSAQVGASLQAPSFANASATPAPSGTLQPFDMDEANRIFHPYKLDIAQLAEQARLLFDKPQQGHALTHDAHTVVQKMIANHPQVAYLSEDQIKRGEFDGFTEYKLDNPSMAELIWNYWHEEGMLVQGINAITLRFQNRLYPGGDKLARCNISHLRPLTNLIWAYVQHEPERLSLARRAYEYDHQYGLRLRGSAVPNLVSADSRTSFIEAFHRVLQEACRYYRTSMDTTMHADAFPMLNCLRELHLILAEGSDNQYSDMPVQARAEMLLQQYILSRPEISDFLGGKPGVPYPEPWMPHLDTLRQVMGWNDASIRHYHTLANCGEMILLSIRHLNWSDIKDSSRAANWLAACRPEIQSYVHSYRAVTGVDLGVFDTPVVAGNEWAVQPSELIGRRRQAAQPRITQ
jgi:hypothetical protein